MTPVCCRGDTLTLLRLLLLLCTDELPLGIPTVAFGPTFIVAPIPLPLPSLVVLLNVLEPVEGRQTQKTY